MADGRRGKAGGRHSFLLRGIESISRIHTYVFVSHDRGVGLIEFAGRESEYGWAGMESTLKSVVESLRWARFEFLGRVFLPFTPRHVMTVL